MNIEGYLSQFSTLQAGHKNDFKLSAVEAKRKTKLILSKSLLRRSSALPNARFHRNPSSCAPIRGMHARPGVGGCSVGEPTYSTTTP